MGLGSSPAGYGPAGLDAPTTTEQRQAVRPTALAFDGPTLNFKLSPRGQYVAAHTIDAKFFERLRTVKSSVRSVPGKGTDIGNQQWIDPLTINAFVADQVRLVSEDMIAAKEIIVHGIELDTSTRGRVMFAVDYTNLKTGKRQPATP